MTLWKISTALFVGTALCLCIPAAQADDGFVHGEGKVAYIKSGSDPATGAPHYRFTLEGTKTYVLAYTDAACVQEGYEADLALLVDQHPDGLKWTINPKQCHDGSGKKVRYTCFVNPTNPSDFACVPLRVVSGL